MNFHDISGNRGPLEPPLLQTHINTVVFQAFWEAAEVGFSWKIMKIMKVNGISLKS